MITDKEIESFWKFYWKIIIRWNFRSFLAFISTAVIWDFISKNYLGSKKWYSSMNNTIDGDFGPDWWIQEMNRGRSYLNLFGLIIVKKGIWSAFWWWFRNHSWNFISLFNPIWNDGDNEEYRILINTIGDDLFNRDKWEDGIYTWLKKDLKKEHELYIAYRIEGKVYCRYSKVWKDSLGRWRQYQKGAGGERYRINRKPLI